MTENHNVLHTAMNRFEFDGDTEMLLLLARKILSVRFHLAVANVSNHWHTVEHDQRLTF